MKETKGGRGNLYMAGVDTNDQLCKRSAEDAASAPSDLDTDRDGAADRIYVKNKAGLTYMR